MVRGWNWGGWAGFRGSGPGYCGAVSRLCLRGREVPARAIVCWAVSGSVFLVGTSVTGAAVSESALQCSLCACAAPLTCAARVHPWLKRVVHLLVVLPHQAPSAVG